MAGALSWPKLQARIAEPTREELRTMPIIQQTWAQSQATAGRMQTHGVTPARSANHDCEAIPGGVGGSGASRGAPSYRLSRRRTGSLPREPASAKAVAPTAVAAGIRVSHLTPESVSRKTTLTHANAATTAHTGQRPFLNSRRLSSDHRARAMTLLPLWSALSLV